ncbi:MAG: YajQ family cyclic di-GMP-binding protein [Gammaproteobacteria bacterium]|nr:YajQ family cyclic di-GMP-binding protein [Gammaproteobacteria bacterium]
MPSFDIVSKVDTQEVCNAVDQANREISTRFDFKGIDAKFAYENEEIVITAPSDFQVKQMEDILKTKLAKRNVDVGSLDNGEISTALHQARQVIKIKQGVDTPTAKEIVKLIKAEKIKVQAAIQGDQVRVTGNKRDDLQTVIAFLRKKDVGLPLQFENFRD